MTVHNQLNFISACSAWLSVNCCEESILLQTDTPTEQLEVLNINRNPWRKNIDYKLSSTVKTKPSKKVQECRPWFLSTSRGHFFQTETSSADKVVHILKFTTFASTFSCIYDLEIALRFSLSLIHSLTIIKWYFVKWSFRFDLWNYWKNIRFQSG